MPERCNGLDDLQVHSKKKGEAPWKHYFFFSFFSLYPVQSKRNRGALKSLSTLSSHRCFRLNQTGLKSQGLHKLQRLACVCIPNEKFLQEFTSADTFCKFCRKSDETSTNIPQQCSPLVPSRLVHLREYLILLLNVVAKIPSSRKYLKTLVSCGIRSIDIL